MIDNLEEKLNGTIPVTREELFELVSSWGRALRTRVSDDFVIDKCEPKECYPLENIDISKINNFYVLFRASLYNGDLSKWDVSNVTNMGKIFSRSMFNNNSIENWDVSKVERLDFAFWGSNFNKNISNWNISNILNLAATFSNSSFDGDISKWNFHKNVDCNNIFFDNENFKNKYNAGNNLPDDTKSFLKWFKENRIKISSLNISKEEISNIDDYLDAFNLDNSKNNLIVFESPVLSNIEFKDII